MNPNSNQKRIAFGYDRSSDNKIIKNETQAAAVRQIFQYYAAGKSLYEIKGLIESQGILSPHNKTTWGKQTLSNILSNPHYIGDEHYPVIISEELFQRAQMIKAIRAKNELKMDAVLNLTAST